MRPPLLLYALLGPLPAAAFYPTKFRANLSKIPGISHEQMTEEVLNSVAGTLFPPVVSSLQATRGVPLSRRMLEARTSIVQSNVWIDWGYPVPEWHFSGESDAESAMILESVKATLVKHLAEGGVDAARINFGQALHLVQDYFAYSHAVQEAGDFEQLWRRGLLSQTTLSGDDSHAYGSEGEGIYHMLVERLNGHESEDSHHQRSAEEAHHNDIVGDDIAANETDRHLRAVKWAMAASEAFIHNIAEYVTDRQLQRLFGVGLDSAILVDPAAFTSPDWTDARSKLGTMLSSVSSFDAEENRAVRYSTVSLLSRSSQASYEWSPLQNTNTTRSLEVLEDMVYEEQVGCHGVELESVLGAMQQLEDGGELVLVVGQGFQGDSDVEGRILDFLADNPVSVTVMQLETECHAGGTVTLSQNIADLSGGAYLTELKTHEALALPQNGAPEAHAGLSVVQMSTHDSESDEIKFLVDGTMDRLVITADWFTPDTSSDTASPAAMMNVLFNGPEENIFAPVARNTNGEANRAVWRIHAPAPGEWGFAFGGDPSPSHNLTIKGRSSIQLVDVSFVESAGIQGHEGYFRILKDVLPADTQVGVVGQVFGMSSDESSSATWFIVDAATGAETEIDMTAGLDPSVRPGYADQNTFFGATTLPEGDFYVIVRGVDDLGYGFQRSLPSRMSAKYYPDETFYIGDVDSVVDFPGQPEPEDEDEPQAEVTMARLVARQTVTGTEAPDFTPPIGAPLTPTGPFFPNTTSLPANATTLANATATTALPTAPTPPFPGTSAFNTSIPSPTIPVPGANFTGPGGATQTAGATFLPPVPGATSIPGVTSVPGEESMTTVATVFPGGSSTLNATSGLSPTASYSSVFTGNGTATANAGAETGTGTSYGYTTTKSVTVTAPCNGPASPGETVATGGAIPQPAASSSQGCAVCGEQHTSIIIGPSPAGPSPSVTITVIPQATTQAQHPMPYPPEQPQPPQKTQTILEHPTLTVETTATFQRTSTIPTQPSVCEACGPQTYGAPANPPVNTPANSSGYSAPPATTMVRSPGPVYGPGASTASANGTFGTQTGGHAGHTTSKAQGTGTATESVDSSETGGSEGEGVKGVRAGVVAAMVVAVGGVVFLVL